MILVVAQASFKIILRREGFHGSSTLMEHQIRITLWHILQTIPTWNLLEHRAMGHIHKFSSLPHCGTWKRLKFGPHSGM
jgi:hypothetical protein